MDPPARNAMWRFGFPNAVNYNDNELFCGGYAVQWEQNSGKCGVCGDAYHVKTPRPHEAGGEFAKGIISRYYASGQVSEQFWIRTGTQILHNNFAAITVNDMMVLFSAFPGNRC